MPKGWFRESYRHSLAAKGIKTSKKATKPYPKVLTKPEYNLIVEAGYEHEPYREMCIVAAGDPFYRYEYLEEFLRSMFILGPRRSRDILGKEYDELIKEIVQNMDPNEIRSVEKEMSKDIKSLLKEKSPLTPFLFNSHREKLWKEVLTNLRESLPQIKGVVDEVFVFGSFISKKERPEDIDIMVVSRDYPSRPYGYWEHWQYNGTDLFLVSHNDKQDMMKFWAGDFLDITKEAIGRRQNA